MEPLPPLVLERVVPEPLFEEQRLDAARDLVAREPRDVLAVEPLELLGVEHGVARADAVERERLHQFLAREQLAVAFARRPAEQRQEVEHRLGQEPLPLVLHHRRRAMALAQASLVGAEDQRHVREARHGRPKRLVEQHLLRGVRDVVVAADDVGDAHVDVVDDDRQVVGRVAVGPQHDEVFDHRVVELDPPMHHIVVRGGAGRHAEADGPRRAGGFARGDLVRRQTGAGPVVGPRLPRGLCRFALRLDVVGIAVAVVGVAGRDQPLGRLAVAVEPLGLEVGPAGPADLRALVPVEAEPPHAVEDPGHHLPRRPLHVGVFDSQDEGAAGVPRVEPVEERGAGAADVQVPGGRRGEANSGCGHTIRAFYRAPAATRPALSEPDRRAGLAGIGRARPRAGRRKDAPGSISAASGRTAAPSARAPTSR